MVPCPCELLGSVVVEIVGGFTGVGFVALLATPLLIPLYCSSTTSSYYKDLKKFYEYKKSEHSKRKFVISYIGVSFRINKVAENSCYNDFRDKEINLERQYTKKSRGKKVYKHNRA